MPGYRKMTGYGYEKGGQKGAQALFDALKKKGYKQDGGATKGKAALTTSAFGYEMKHGGSCGKVRKASYYRKGKR